MLGKHQMLSKRVGNLSESITFEMTRLSRELKEQGIDIITLSIGEPDFNTPEPVKQAGISAIEENITHYPPVAGYNKLRSAIAEKLKRDNGLEFDPQQIIVSNGAKQSIINVLLCTINPGDEVIIPAPYWVSYPEMVRIAEGKPIFIDSDVSDKFKVDAAQIEAAITSRTKAFVFSSPCNPTGSFYSKEELYQIWKVLEKHPNILIISDEIYEYINFKGRHESIAQFDPHHKQVALVNGVSKGYSMTGWRIGYVAAPLYLAKACNILQGQLTSGPSSISQMAAIEALQLSPESSHDIQHMQQAFRERRDLLFRLVSELPGFETFLPDGAFYLFPDISAYFGKQYKGKTIRNARDLCLFLLEEAHVALVPGDGFGCPSCIRFSYATSNEQIILALDRIKQKLKLLQ